MLLYAWLSSWVNDDEELAQCGISSEEFDRLEGVSVTHGYGLEDGTWTEEGSKLSRQVQDPDLDLSEMDDDPRWVLVRQAWEEKSMQT